ncbi:MAG: HAMP domain-containing protein [Rhodobacteraceae bacterium]|nr:HAMP domain-containing protein [Paracoccaceae bacterium]
MSGWFKRFLPRGLYGRAALILIVPIVTLQLVVSAAFLQRHFEDVTDQLTTALVLDLRYVLDQLAAAGPGAARATADNLRIEMTGAAPPAQDAWLWYDLSGHRVIEVLRRELPEVRFIDLAEDDRRVRIGLLTGSGEIELAVRRSRVSASNPHQLLVLMVFTGLLMTGIAYIFLRNQLRPIRRLARAAEAFGKGKVLDYNPHGALEVHSAGRAFLDMRSRIERQIEQRTMMLSGVSHDLRSPLTRMKLALGLMEPSEETAALERDVEEMRMLLDTFLDFARADALDDPVPADPQALAKAVLDNARQAGGNVELKVGQQVQPVDMRAQAVQRALGNLVSNALRHGSRVRVTLQILDHAVRYTVEDDGPGIPPAKRAGALRPFSRLDRARNQDRGSGVGLGLTIASDIAHSHGGTLRLSDSTDLGGLRVDFVLAR